MNDRSGSADRPRPNWVRTVISALLYGSIFGLAGALISVRSFAENVLPHIITSPDAVEFRYLSEGRPVPHLLDWNYPRLQLLLSLKEMSPLLLIATSVGLFGGLWLFTIRLLNPTFHPFQIRTPEPLLPPASSETESVTEIEAESGAEPDTEPDTVQETDSPSETEPETPEPSATDPTAEPPVPAPNSIISIGKVSLFEDIGDHLHVDPVHLEQALRITGIVGLPLVAVLALLGAFGTQPLLGGPLTNHANAVRNELFRAIAFGVALFAGFGRHGIAGRFGILHQAYQSDEAVTPGRPGVSFKSFVKTILLGALFGGGAWALFTRAVPVPTESLLVRLQALGTFNIEDMDLLFRPYILSSILCWGGTGILLWVLGKEVRIPSLAPRLLLAGLVFLSWVALGAISAPVTEARLVQNYDVSDSVLATASKYDPRRLESGVPAGSAAGNELAKRLHMITAADKMPTGHDVLVFYPRGPFQVEVQEVTDDGLLADPAKLKVVEEYLKKRNYRTALSWVAIKYLFNEANLELDSAAAIRAGLQDLEYCPHVTNTSETVRDMLFLCNASPENLRLMDEYADESKFAHPTRASCRMIAMMYNRFGEANKAFQWFRKADMPAGFLQRIKTEKPVFNSGVAKGRLLLNGRPVAGVRVGVVPERLNGLPKELEYFAMRYSKELFSDEPDSSSYFAPFHPRPFRLRWVTGGATTNANGEFTIDHLTEGEYYLVCSLPSGIQLTVPEDTRLVVDKTPPAFTVNYSLPQHDMKQISLHFKP